MSENPIDAYFQKCKNLAETLGKCRSENKWTQYFGACDDEVLSVDGCLDKLRDLQRLASKARGIELRRKIKIWRFRTEEDNARYFNSRRNYGYAYAYDPLRRDNRYPE